MGRSFLFVPGDRPERFVKADNSKADVIVLDLEDAVSVDKKSKARANVVQWIEEGHSCMVRINPPGTPYFDDDVTALGRLVKILMIPKVDRPEDIESTLTKLPKSCGVVPLMETARGVVNGVDICSSPNVVRAVFGNADLSADLGVEASDDHALLYYRCQVVLASAASHIAAPVDGVTAEIGDPDLLELHARSSRRLGFTGKLCLHPSQVALVNELFSPQLEEVEWARQILSESDDRSPRVSDGKVVGEPIYKRARRIILTADALNK